jgi:hypothetical protein
MRSMGCALYIRCALSIHKKGMSKKFGVRVTHRCELSTGKYGTLRNKKVETLLPFLYEFLLIKCLYFLIAVV